MLGCTIFLACRAGVGGPSAWPLALTLRIPSSWMTRAPRFQDPRPYWNGNLKFRCCVLGAEGVRVLESEPRAPRPLTSPWGHRRALFRGNRIQILLSWALKGVVLNLPVLGLPLIPWLPKSIVEGRRDSSSRVEMPPRKCVGLTVGCSNYKAEPLSSRGHWTDSHKELFRSRCPLFLY